MSAKVYTTPLQNLYEGTRPGGAVVVLYHDYTLLEARIRDLETALVYSAFAQHGTPQYMLPKGIALIDNDRVVVTLKDGRKVTASDAGGEGGT